MNGTRWTTLSSRFLMGLSGSFLAHLIPQKFIPYGLIFFLITLVGGAVVLLCFEGQTPKTKTDKSKGDSTAIFGQWQTILICFAAIIGGTIRWLG